MKAHTSHKRRACSKLNYDIDEFDGSGNGSYRSLGREAYGLDFQNRFVLHYVRHTYIESTRFTKQCARLIFVLFDSTKHPSLSKPHPSPPICLQWWHCQSESTTARFFLAPLSSSSAALITAEMISSRGLTFRLVKIGSIRMVKTGSPRTLTNHLESVRHPFE